MSAAPNILVVDDEPSMLRYMQTLLELDCYAVETAASGEDAISRLSHGPAPDLVLLDMLMPGSDGLQTLEQMKQIKPELKVVMLSCVSDTRKVVQAIRLGAKDYLTKPFQKADLDSVLQQCLQRAKAAEISDEGTVEELGDDRFMLIASAAMKRVREQVNAVANVDVPVLILGESGTGKEVVARMIHKLSTRAHRTFMKVNCAALPADLLESELFGYEPGAFTGAVKAKPGKFELCNKGTILLDEIGEIPPMLQAKLLHVLQDQQFSRLGGRSMVQVDVRILAATNIDIPQALATKRLREDLYYRLNAFSIQVPPLRERKEAIPLLIKQNMLRLSERYGCSPLPITQHLIDACVNYNWPGNLRELENFIKRYLVLGDEALAISELSPKGNLRSMPSPDGNKPAANGDLKSMVRSLKDEAEMQAIAQALDQTDWNRKEAALLLNISYKALLYKIRQYGLTRQSTTRTARVRFGA